MESKNTDTSEASTAAAAGSTAAIADAPPSSVSLDVVIAMHDRLLKLKASHQSLDEEVGALNKAVDEIGKMIRDEMVGQLSDLTTTVGQHADLIDGLSRTLDDIATRLSAQPRRGETERRLPPPADGSTGLELEHGTTAPGHVTELQIDPTKVGEQLVKIPGGPEVIVNVRRPTESGGGFIRDGQQPPGRGKVRRS